MTNRPEAAVACFKEGFSCSQAVLTAYGELFHMDRETSLRISQPFGGGMAHMRQICGAVTGAFMVIGLKYGRIRVEDTEAKAKTYALVQELAKKFKARYGSLFCHELIKYDISTEEGLQKAKEENIFEVECPNFIRSAAEILEEFL